MSTKKKVIVFVLIFLVIFSALMMAKDRFFLFEKQVSLPIIHKNYVANTIEKSVSTEAAQLPDLSGFTLTAIQSKIPSLEKGNVTIAPIEFLEGMEKFTEKRRLVEFSRLQKTADPVAIAIHTGHYNLETLTQEVDNPDYIEKLPDGAFLLKRPLYIEHDASLTIDGTPEKLIPLKMSSVSGGFIVNGGKIFILHAHIEGWNDSANSPSIFNEARKRDFRPFFVSWSDSESYFYGSTFSHLGYGISKSYGISFSSAKFLLKKDPLTPAPHGWLINNIFEGLFYGFYSYEAEDVAIVGNTYRNNIIYGIDPHDRSKRLIIAKNIAYGTQQKHGIIVSREVNDSWIFDNISFYNHGSGIMLDRTCVRNIVSGNIAFLNGGDGLTLFESQGNQILGNILSFNARSGYRARNSWDVTSISNWVVFNGGDGIHAYSFDIKKTEKDRDFIEDPFTEKAALSITNDKAIGNLTGTFKFNKVDYVDLTGIEFGLYSKRFLRGDLDNIGRDVAKALTQTSGTLRIRYDVSANQKAPSLKQNESKKREKKVVDILGNLDEDESAE